MSINPPKATEAASIQPWTQITTEEQTRREGAENPRSDLNLLNR